MFSLVIYVPSTHAEKMREVLAISKAGAVGNYDSCSFTGAGTGRFRPLANSLPAIGSLNKLEEVDEVRIETVVQKQFLAEAVKAAKKAHPYEEPAIHITEIIDYKLYLGNDDFKSTSSALSRFGPISVVLEGLDGVGKSTVAEKLAAVLNAEHMMTPPAIMRTGREWFVKQDNHMRKAYYMVGNFIAGSEMQQCVEKQQRSVVLDRYFASTIAYIVGKKDTHLPLPAKDDPVFAWPDELYRPSCMIVLVLPEADRVLRRQGRTAIEETPEEKLLREDPRITERINQCYEMLGCLRVEIEGSDNVDAVVNKIIAAIEGQLAKSA
eukprot:gene11229-13068_t